MLMTVMLLVVGQCVPERPGWARRFVGEKNAQVLESATSVELYRINPYARGRRNSVHTFAVLGHRTVEPGVARELADIVLSDESLERGKECTADASYGSIKLCGGFQPGVMFRVHAGPRRVDLLVCFDCDDLAVVTRTVVDRQSLMTRDVGGGSGALLALTARLLPDDPAINSMAKRKRLAREDREHRARLQARLATGGGDGADLARAFLSQEGAIAGRVFTELAATSWSGEGHVEAALSLVLQELTSTELVAAAVPCLEDARCRTGAARAFLELGGLQRLSTRAYGRLLPLVAEVALREADQYTSELVIWRLALWRTPETTRLLWRIFDGDLLPRALPSAKVLALVALNRQSLEEARLALELFVPTTPEEQTALRFAWALVGRPEGLTATDLARARTPLALAGVDSVRRFRRKDLLGLLVEGALENREPMVSESVEAAFKELLGKDSPNGDTEIRRWWKANGARLKR
ncbi:MAG: hypothetical protein Q8L48_03515 [Archangium sp.]|nr:hypothetical protein [Archangium sp.]